MFLKNLEWKVKKDKKLNVELLQKLGIELQASNEP
jgi:hypothetical protein